MGKSYYYSDVRKSSSTTYATLGSGMALYPMIDPQGGLRVARDLDKVLLSMENIIKTEKGSRLFIPEYGSLIYTVLFEPNDDLLKDSIPYYIKDALKLWEPRISVSDVSVIEISDTALSVECSFTLVGSSELLSTTFDFSRS